VGGYCGSFQGFASLIDVTLKFPIKLRYYYRYLLITGA